MFIGRFGNEIQYPATYQLHRHDDIISDVEVECFEDKEYKIHFWGVIFNKKELGGEHTNASLAAMLYNRRGISGFSLLDGSFVFVLIHVDGTVMVGRDHHGTCSQVYYNKKYFASSLALIREMDNSAQPDYASLSSFLTIGYVSTPFSSFKGINKLEAGHILMVKGGKQETFPLFDTSHIEPVSSCRSLEEYSDEYGRLHTEAIRRRIGDSRNVGVLLSGGYDSGCNLAALRRIYDGKVNSYSIGFKGDDWTELPLARCMSETFHTVHHEYEIDGTEILNLPDIVSYLGDPFVEGGLMVNYAAMRMIGDRKPDVILGGDGSDQYFGTSGRELAIHYLMAKYGCKPVLNGIYAIVSRSVFEKNNKPYRLRFHLDKILNILEGDLFGFPSFILKDLLQKRDCRSPHIMLSPDLRSFEHLYIQHTYKSDIEKIINQVILFKASRMASMFGNNIVFPYMDNALYDFLKELPVTYKCNGTSVKSIARGQVTAKYLLKYHYKPMLPVAITAKKKQGGFAPMPIFFKDSKQRARLADFILSSSVVDEYFNRAEVEAFIRNYDMEAVQQGNWFWYRQNKAIQYFNLLTLAVWWEIFVKGNKDVKL